MNSVDSTLTALIVLHADKFFAAQFTARIFVVLLLDINMSCCRVLFLSHGLVALLHAAAANGASAV